MKRNQMCCVAAMLFWMVAPLALSAAENDDRAVARPPLRIVKKPNAVMTKDGLSVSLAQRKDAFKATEALAFDLTLTNQTDKDFSLWPDPKYLDQIRIRIEDKNGAVWIGESTRQYRRRAIGAVIITAHGTVTVPVEMEETTYRFDPEGKGAAAALAHLPAGDYRITAALDCIGSPAQEPNLPPAWLGKIETPAAVFAIAK